MIENCRSLIVRSGLTSVHGVLKFPQFGQLEKYVIRIHPRHEQPGRSLAKAAAQHVIADERESWVEKQLERIRSAAFREPLFGRERGVAINRREMMRDIAVRVVLQFVSKEAGRAIGLD